MIENKFNPFLLGGYTEPQYFCNRNKEIIELANNINSKFNTTIFAMRRLGKTGLIQHLFYQLKVKKTVCMYIDIYATQSLKDFTNLLSNCIYQNFPNTKSIGKQFLEAIKSFRPVVSFDSLSGLPELSLDISQTKQFEKTIPQLLQFLDSRNIKIIIAIDEFQQILTYPEKNIEAILRTSVQSLKNINFIFCGSNQTLMHNIFNTAKRPFYASCKNLHLDKIANEEYFAFIKNHFTINKRKIANEAIEYILEFTFSHTYFTQYICHQLFATNSKNITLQDTQLICKKALEDNAPTFFQFRNLLTASQWHLLKAIAKSEKLFQPFAKEFISKNNLGSSAIVKRSLESLLQKEMIHFNNTEQVTHYAVYDKFLLRWMQYLP